MGRQPIEIWEGVMSRPGKQDGLNSAVGEVQPGLPASLRYLALAAALSILLLIVLGGIVRVTGSGGSCPDWPTCFGQWTPPVGESAALDYFHRFATILVTPLVVGLALVAGLRARRVPRIRVSALAALVLLGVQILLGGLVATHSIAARPWLTAVHLGLSLLIQALVLVAAVVAFYQPASPNLSGKFSFRSPFARLSVFTLIALFVLLVSGSVVAATQSNSACAGWPLCGTGVLPADPTGWLQVIHRLLVGGAGLLMAALFLQAWRTQRTQAPVLVATTAAFVLFVSQALLGIRMVQGFPAYLIGLHEATAAGVWAALVVQVTAVGISARSAQDERVDARTVLGRKGLALDLLLLTKPIVVALLLVTTFAGMVIGARQWPSFWTAFWTLLGGFLAAGGSGAINQYIDRRDDEKMQRTQKRPIPAGRLTPAEGLAFGVGIALGSFFLLVAFVNFIAALLSLAGIIYYVLIYSIFLKKTTVQNIVIGGGAGAIPPLVGWAAATGGLNIPSLFLFAVIFMWTPPHFWALSIVRLKDYARAGVPMLPVVRGEAETRWQIFLYTAELVALTLVLPVFGLGGAVYMAGALLLGMWLLSAAWKVWKGSGNKVAWRMYRYSSMYLAFLFIVLMIDRLLK
jgi:protoheme IX farnesyltransferase